MKTNVISNFQVTLQALAMANATPGSQSPRPPRAAEKPLDITLPPDFQAPANGPGHPESLSRA